MQWQAGAEYGTYNDFVVTGIDLTLVEWGLDGLFAVRKELTDLVGLNMSDADDVLAESHTFTLYIHIAQLCQKGIENTVAFAKIDYFHD